MPYSISPKDNYRANGLRLSFAGSPNEDFFAKAFDQAQFEQIKTEIAERYAFSADFAKLEMDQVRQIKMLASEFAWYKGDSLLVMKLFQDVVKIKIKQGKLPADAFSRDFGPGGPVIQPGPGLNYSMILSAEIGAGPTGLEDDDKFPFTIALLGLKMNYALFRHDGLYDAVIEVRHAK